MRVTASAAILTAEIPFSGATPACAARPSKRAVNVKCVGAAMTMPPGDPSASSTRQRFPVTADGSRAFAPRSPTSSCTVNTHRTVGRDAPDSATRRTLSIAAARPALSSAPSTVSPAEKTSPSEMTGSTPRPGSTVSKCADSTRVTGASPGSSAMRLPQSEPVRCWLSSYRTVQPAASSAAAQ